MTGVHISKVTDKRARALVSTDLIHGDGYHDRIWKHAQLLAQYGHGDYEYVTGWGSGSTVWRNDDHGHHTCTVRRLREGHEVSGSIGFYIRSDNVSV